MGAFNTLKDKQVCHVCGNMVEFGIQFKYGNVWQHTYRIGDEIHWGKENIGIQNSKKVLVYAIAENCPICNSPGADYEILIEYDVIISAEHISGKYDFVNQNRDYIIIDE